MVIKLHSTLVNMSTTCEEKRIVYEETRVLEPGQTFPCLVEIADEEWRRGRFEPGIATVKDGDTLFVQTRDGDEGESLTFARNLIPEAQGMTYLGFRARPKFPLRAELRIQLERVKKVATLGLVGADLEKRAEIVWEPPSKERR